MKNILRLLTGGLVAAFFAIAAHASELAPGAFSAGTVRGDVSYKVAGSSEYQKLSAGVALPQGATIKTGANSSVVVVFGSGSIAAIPANSEVEITKFEQALFSGPVPINAEPAVSNTEIRLIDGGVTSKVAKLKKGSAYTVNTPVGAAGVRGTIFNVWFKAETNEFSISCAEGEVVYSSNEAITTPIAAGQRFLATLEFTPPNTFTLSGATVGDLPDDVRAEIEAAVGVIASAMGLDTDPVLILNPVDTTQIGVSPN
jgi:hypothetical protein